MIQQRGVCNTWVTWYTSVASRICVTLRHLPQGETKCRAGFVERWFWPQSLCRTTHVTASGVQAFCAFIERQNETKIKSKQLLVLYKESRWSYILCSVVYMNYLLLICNSAFRYVCYCPRHSSKTTSKMGSRTSTSLKWPWGFSHFSDNAIAYSIMFCTHSAISRTGPNLFLLAAHQSYQSSRVHAELMPSSLLCL